ncbi:MAG: Txe/YoeB family addiction module toxin [Desulfobacula sp.]|nr:Txe/YoeB family addiction module toxin [Desulfobacula sp.]
MSWRVVFTKQAQKDAQKISASNLKSKAEKIINIIRRNPFQTPPFYAKLVGDLAGAYSRRLNIQHRIVYQVIADEKTVKIICMWTHYE